MVGICVTLLCSLWILYEYIAFWGILGIPYIGIERDIFVLLTVARGVVMKWGLIIGVFGVLYAIFGLVLFRRNSEIDLKWGVPIFYIVTSLLVLV